MTSPADAAIALFQDAAHVMRSSPQRRGCAIRLPARGRLIATGDLHDNPIHLDKLVRFARLDESDEHHLVLHEMIHGDRLVNGIDFSHRMLARVARLTCDHPMQVHPLLANHEIAQFTGRGVSKGAGNSVELFNEGLRYVHGDDWESVRDAINVFIGSMPLALLSEHGVCCAHSLPDARKMDRFDPGVLDRPLEEADFVSPNGAAYLMTWGRHHTEDQVERLASAWEVRLFVLGHQHVETGVEVRGPRVIVLNSDHERAAALPLDLARIPEPDETLMFAVPLASIA